MLGTDKLAHELSIALVDIVSLSSNSSLQISLNHIINTRSLDIPQPLDPFVHSYCHAAAALASESMKRLDPLPRVAWFEEMESTIYKHPKNLSIGFPAGAFYITPRLSAISRISLPRSPAQA